MAKQREAYANNAHDVLDGGINNSVTSLSLLDGRTFPSIGNFRIKINTEIMKVIATSGDKSQNLTVERGSSPTTHSDGDQVTQVWNYDAALQAVKDNVLMAGDAPALGRITNSSGNFMTVSSMTAVGYTGVSSDDEGMIYMDVPAAPTGTFAFLVTSAPSTPWTATLGIQFFNSNDNNGTNGFAQGCLALRESSTNKFICHNQYSRQGTALFGRPTYRSQISKLNSPVSYNSQYISETTLNHHRETNWYRVTDNGTNLIFYQSADGVNWWEQYSVSRTDWLATGPNQVGFGCSPEGCTMALNPRVLVTHFDIS